MPRVPPEEGRGWVELRQKWGGQEGDAGRKGERRQYHTARFSTLLPENLVPALLAPFPLKSLQFYELDDEIYILVGLVGSTMHIMQLESYYSLHSCCTQFVCASYYKIIKLRLKLGRF